MKTIAKSARWLSYGSRFFSLLVSAALVAVLLVAEAATAAPWNPMTSAIPRIGPDHPTPKATPGKDFSDFRDRDLNGVGDTEQVVAWDGTGGVRDSFDYSMSRAAYPEVSQDIEVDGIAAGGDALFHALRNNQATLLFSVGPTPMGHPNQVYYVRPTNFLQPNAGHGVWATLNDIDSMNQLIDLDGLEVWGSDQLDDSDRYSLRGDPFTSGVVPNEMRKVAIYSYTPPAANTSVHHTLTTDLAASIDMLYDGGLGYNEPIWGQLVELMDVDAIMTFGQQVTFSIAPLTINLPTGAPIVFDGGEIFEYDGPGIPARFLKHGGYTWDTSLNIRTTFNVPEENIDALEAVAVPEPASVALVLIGVLAVFQSLMRRR